MGLTEKIRDVVQRDGDRLREEVLLPWLAIPTISTQDGHADDVRKGAKFISSTLTNMGFSSRLIEVDRLNPLVFAEYHAGDDKPTILVYGHNDVQQADETTWTVDGITFDPFSPTQIGDVLYGRGTADDKGQLFTLLLGVHAAKEACGGELPVNIKFLIESNEEHSIGEMFPEWVAANHALLAANVVAVADCERHEDGPRPVFNTGLKGIAAGKLNADDPFTLAQLLTSFSASGNRVDLPGFYDCIGETQPIDDPLTLELLAPEPKMGSVIVPEEGFDQATHRARRPTYDPLSFLHINRNPAHTTNTYSVRITAQGPTETLHSGIYGGPVQNPGLYLARAATILASLRGEDVDVQMDFARYGSKGIETKIHPQGEMQVTLTGVESEEDALRLVRETIQSQWTDGDISLLSYEIPADREDYLTDMRFGNITSPEANVSFRLVAGQNPAEVEKVIIARGEGYGARWSHSHPGEPFRADIDNEYCRVLFDASAEMSGEDPLFFDEGGSIPIVGPLSKIAPVVLYAFGPRDNNIHNRNEQIRLPQINDGAAEFAQGLLRLGEK